MSCLAIKRTEQKLELRGGTAPPLYPYQGHGLLLSEQSLELHSGVGPEFTVYETVVLPLYEQSLLQTNLLLLQQTIIQERSDASGYCHDTEVRISARHRVRCDNRASEKNSACSQEQC